MKKFPSQYTIRFRKNVDPRILEFADQQDNLTDTILYLIEKEISENGIRNLQEHIPFSRNILKPKGKLEKPKEEKINDSYLEEGIDKAVKEDMSKVAEDSLDIPKEYLD